MVSAHVPDVASNKQNALVRLGIGDGAGRFNRFGRASPWSWMSSPEAAFGEVIVHAVLLSRISSHHAQVAVVHKQQTFNTRKANGENRPVRGPRRTARKPTKGRRFTAWCCKKAEPRKAGERRSSRRCPSSGRLTGSPFLGAHRGSELARVSANPGRRMDALRIETRGNPGDPRPRTPPASTSQCGVRHAFAEVRTKAGGVREIHTRPGGRRRYGFES